MGVRAWRVAALLGLAVALATTLASAQAGAALGTDRYIARLSEPPPASYRGGIAGLAATNPAATGSARLNPASPASKAYLDHLSTRHAAVRAAMQAALGRTVEVPFTYRYAFNGFAAVLTEEEAAAVSRLPGVSDVEKEFVRELQTDVGPAWIGAPGIWSGADTGGLAGTKGEGVVVGVIDTGINYDHPSFADKGGDGYDHVNPRGTFYGLCNPITGAPFCNDKLIGVYDFTGTGPEDDNGHGSHVAGTVAATNNTVGVVGMAPQADLWAVKVLSRSGSGTISGIVQGINWVISHNNGGKPKVINMSLGGTGSDDQDGLYCPATRSSNGFHNVIQKAVCDNNITVVVAAGNDGQDAALHTPAAYDEVITVSATKQGDDWPSWSNWGHDVDIAAPGVSILSTWNTSTTAYNTISGTSMASPHVAGAAAVVLSANPGYTPAQVKTALLNNAESTSGWTNTSGNPHPEPFLNVRGF